MLRKVIKKAKELGIKIEYLPITEKGRYLRIDNQDFIFLKQDLSDFDKINVLLHELGHFNNEDGECYLTTVETYLSHLEYDAEISRIRDFLSLVNHEYPIDEHFNYINYMEATQIPSRFENIVKETAQELYEKNKKTKRI